MNNSRAIIIVPNREALRVAAGSARISTQSGTAMEIFESSLGDARDLKLMDKVLASGHKSVIEHQTLSVAFENVSVLMEQFIIEARLASFTVKSRRYVDFSRAGFVVPDGLTEGQRAAFEAAMTARFADYQALLDMGVPKEDARFVLPYSLRSNFFMTLNARELIALVCALLKGRGQDYAEAAALGRQLKAQFDGMYPGVIDGELARFPQWHAPELPGEVRTGQPRRGGARLIGQSADARALLREALSFSGRFGAAPELTPDVLRALLLDPRPRELELLNYTFRVEHISLACLTHFARHRMQSPVIPPVFAALSQGDFVLPDSVAALPEAERVYRAAFAAQAQAAADALAGGLSPQMASYYALSGHQLDILLSMNARELMHFMKLRTCERAQWEIRGVAVAMLEQARAALPELFDHYGPSCRYGKCPEGRMTCGKPRPRI